MNHCSIPELLYIECSLFTFGYFSQTMSSHMQYGHYTMVSTNAMVNYNKSGRRRGRPDIHHANQRPMLNTNTAKDKHPSDEPPCSSRQYHRHDEEYSVETYDTTAPTGYNQPTACDLSLKETPDQPPDWMDKFNVSSS